MLSHTLGHEGLGLAESRAAWFRFGRLQGLRFAMLKLSGLTAFGLRKQQGLGGGGSRAQNLGHKMMYLRTYVHTYSSRRHAS